MKSERRKKILAKKKDAKRKRYAREGHVSDYARRRDFCRKNGVWGFQVSEPKPWKRSE